MARRDGFKTNTLATVLLRLGLAEPALQAAQRSQDEATALAAQAVTGFESSIAAWTVRARSGPAVNPNAQRRIGWMRTQLLRSQQAPGRPALCWLRRPPEWVA